MLKFWSEIPTARAREMVADVATWIWVSVWVVIGAKIYAVISAFAEAGRVLQQGGANIQGAGATLGGAIGDVPLIGPGIGDLTTGAFATAGDPFVFVGRELEALLILIARLLALLVVGVMVVLAITTIVVARWRRWAEQNELLPGP